MSRCLNLVIRFMQSSSLMTLSYPYLKRFFRLSLLLSPPMGGTQMPFFLRQEHNILERDSLRMSLVVNQIRHLFERQVFIMSRSEVVTFPFSLSKSSIILCPAICILFSPPLDSFFSIRSNLALLPSFLDWSPYLFHLSSGCLSSLCPTTST